MAPMPMRKMRPPTTPEKKVGMLEQLEIEDRVLVAAGVPDVGGERARRRPRSCAATAQAGAMPRPIS